MKGLIPTASNFLKKNSSTILTIASSIGVVGTAILSSKATIKAIDILDSREVSKKEAIKLTWKCYVPTILVASATVACIVSSNVLSIRRQKSLANAFNLLNQSFFTYKNKLKELYGEEAHNKIINEIVMSKCDETFITTQSILSNDHLYFDTTIPEPIRTFYDSYSKRYFESTIPRVLEAEYHFNRNYILAGRVAINMFYDMLGLEPYNDDGADAGGDIIGFDSFEDTLPWIDFSHSTATLDDGMEIMVIDFTFGPTTLAYDD